MRLPLIVALSLSATPAFADLGEYCQREIAAGNITGVSRIADMILFSAGDLSLERAAVAGECIKAATGVDHVYSPKTKSFEQVSDRTAKAFAQQKATAERLARAREPKEATVSAEISANCITSARAGDSLKARLIALDLIETPAKRTAGEAEQIIQCLLQASGGKYQYDASTGIFFTSDQAADQAIRRSRQERATAEAAAEAEQEAATAARTEKFLADVEQRQAERRANVVERLSEACTRQYGRDPDATILNKLCFDVFMERGLPD